MTAEEIQIEVDIAYKNMMAARTETGERYWVDRLKHFIMLRKQHQIEPISA